MSMDDQATGTLLANVVDVAARRIVAAQLRWHGGRISAVEASGPAQPGLPYLLPGFVDAHVHIESSLLPPTEFARVAVCHGTVASVSDPHEIANVLGIDGVRWMLENAALTPFKIVFGAPSCVPATVFETSGAVIDANAVAELLALPGVGYLSEVMNFPGVLSQDQALQPKISAALRNGQPVDGHAPGLVGEQARRYADAGISTDHECLSLAEAEDKIRAGMKILIREGSAARQFDVLHPLLGRYPGQVMLCTDDCHPDDLATGHINVLVARAIAQGHDLFHVLEAACLVPQRHYGLALGQLRCGDPMTAVLVNDLRQFAVQSTWIDGYQVARQGKSLLPKVNSAPINRFAAEPVRAENFVVSAKGASQRCRVIVAEDGQLFTRSTIETLPVVEGQLQNSVEDDLLWLAVVNRYQPAPPALALVRGFGLKCGALASSVAHDSHNVIAVGCDAQSLARAVNAVVASRGGLAIVNPDGVAETLDLPIAGLMSDQDGRAVAARYAGLNQIARQQLGSPLRAPFMTLSFMALLVIPELKLSDRGLFDSTTFSFTEVTCSD